jgi:spore germination protein KB
MFYPSIVEITKVRKSAILATVFTGIILSLNSVIFISVLGEDLSLNSLFPFLQTMRTMKLGDSFDRLDIFIIVFLMLGGFFKICFFMSGAIFGTSQLINLKNSKYLVIPFGIIVLVISQLIASNYPQHIKIGLDFTVKYIHIPLIIVVPLIALTVYYLKIMIKKL